MGKILPVKPLKERQRKVFNIADTSKSYISHEK